MKIRLGIAGAGALLLVGIGIGASAYAGGAPVPFLVAAKPSPSPGTPSAACTNFMNHLAKNLGISQSQLHSALQKSADQTIDDAVAAGKLSAAQAAKLKQRIDSGAVCNFAPRFGGQQHMGRMGSMWMMAVVKAAAETLNLTPQQLIADVRQGQTVSSLAHGMSEAQFRTAMLTHLKADLDAQVKAGKLTSTQESSLLQRLQNVPIPFWSKAGGFGGHSFLPPALTPSPATGA